MGPFVLCIEIKFSSDSVLEKSRRNKKNGVRPCLRGGVQCLEPVANVEATWYMPVVKKRLGSVTTDKNFERCKVSNVPIRCHLK